MDASGFSGILGDSDDDVQAALDTLDGYVPDTMQEFVFGQGYHRNDLVRYQDVLYRAKVIIAEADEVPPLDPDNWVEQSSHRLEGYGEVFDQEPATIEFVTVALPARSTAIPVTVPVTLHANLHSGLPQSLIVVETGKLKARIDGVVVLFDTDYVSNLVGTLPVDGVAQVSLVLQGRVGDTGAWRSIAAGVTTWADGVSQGTISLANANASFSLDTDDLLEFRWVYSLLQGARGEIFTHHSQTEDLAVKVSGIRETRHVLAHGTGENAGKITIEDSVADTTTAIIDIGAHGGPTYVGPVALRIFEIGEDYGLDETVQYRDVIYRAIADITAAAEVPALDPDNWVELTVHGIEGYGIPVNDLSVTLVFEDVTTEAYDSIASFQYPLVLSIAGLEDGIAHIDDEGRLVADNDGLSVRFAAGQTLQWVYNAEGHATDDSNMFVALTVRKNGGSVFDLADTGQFVLDHEVDSITLNLTTVSKTYELNRGDTLFFELAILGNNRAAGTATQGDDETRAMAVLSGNRHSRYSLHWGAGDDDGKLIITNQDGGTPIFEFREGAPVFLVESLPEFQFGARYHKDNFVQYQDVIYRARVDIDAASNLPPLDRDNWAEIDSHAIKGYGSYIENGAISLNFFNATIPAFDADTDTEAEAVGLPVFGGEGLPNGYLRLENNNLAGRVDGVGVTLDADTTWSIRISATADEASTGTVELQARKNSESWATVKTGTFNMASGDTEAEIILTSDADSTWSLDEDDELHFRATYILSAGSVQEGTIVDRANLALAFSAGQGNFNQIGFGTGSDGDKVQGYAPAEDETTDLIEFDEDGVAKWVGPLGDHVVLDRNLREPGSMAGNFLGDGTHRFEVVNGVPGVGEITHAAELGETQVRIGVSESQEAAGLDRADALIFYGTGGGDAGAEQAQFRVYSRTFTPITDDDDEVIGYVFVFTGRVVQLNPGLDSFAFGSVGDETDVSFLERTHVAGALPHHSREHRLVGYGGDGDLTEIPYEDQGYLNLPVTRPRGLWMDIVAAYNPDTEGEATVGTISGGLRIQIWQKKVDPKFRYDHYFDEGDIVEVRDGNDYYIGVVDAPVTLNSVVTFYGVRIDIRYLRRHGGNSNPSYLDGDTFRIVTDRHGRLVIPEVYSSNIDFTTEDRFLRIDLGRPWDEFDFLGISYFNDESDNQGFAYREIPVNRLKECFEVDSDYDDNPNDTPNDTDQYFAFRDRLRPDDDLRWGLARSDHGDGFQGIAVYTEDTSDDPQPFRVDYILQR